MLKNYLKIAWRTIMRHKLFSFINIFGLATGMAVCILALIDIRSGYQYDHFHPDAERIYRVNTVFTGKDNATEPYASAPYLLGAELDHKYSFIENCVQVYPVRTTFLKAGNDLNISISYTGKNFFKVFGFRLLKGRFSEEPRSVVLTEATAEKFFGKSDPVGQVMHHKLYGDFVVTGVLRNNHQKSHLQFDMLGSIATLTAIQQSGKFDYKLTDWTNAWACYTYVKLKKGASGQSLAHALKSYSKTATSFLPNQSGIKRIDFEVQRFNDITPSKVDYLNFPGGPTMGQLAAESAVGLVTLLLAVFNYINLTLARSITRSREVGIRKVIGARRWQLVAQFMTESVLISMCALVFAGVVIKLIGNFNITQKILNDAQWDAGLYVSIIVFVVLTGLIAGFIPARLLSSFKPGLVLKSQTGAPVFQRLTMRRLLIVIQFAVSMTGVIGMTIMNRQQVFMATTEYGFNREGILNIDLQGKDYRLTASELSRVPGIERVSATSTVLGFNGGDYQKVYNNSRTVYSATEIISADPNFMLNMGLKLDAGHHPAPKAADEVLINETAVKAFRFKNAAQAINELIRLNDSTQVRVSGVLKDFHSMSMHFPIIPMVIVNNPANFNTLQVKIAKGTDHQAIINQLATQWKRLYPQQVFSAQWFDTMLYEHHMHNDDQLFILMIIGITLSIACLGLLGMVIYTTQIRVKEIGIRKVLGAGVGRIVFLLAKDFLKLLLIAAIVAMPVGLIAGNLFLRNFAYHVSIGPGIVSFGFLVLLLTGGVTIAVQSLKAAMANPVKSLRNE